MPSILTRLIWAFFALSIGAVAVHGLSGEAWTLGAVLRVDGLTLVMSLVITFVSGVVHSFARRYMAGSRHLDRFYVRLFGLTLIVLLLTAADHLVLFVGAWTAMGWVLADLIGHIRGWKQAQAAARRARWSFLGGSALLAAGLTVLALSTEATTISGVLRRLDALSLWAAVGAGGFVLLAAMIQSALVPFHGWLLSSMTAPTPVSAFMHAGLVNAGGVLLARFAPVAEAVPAVMQGIVLIGAVSALLAQAWMLVQTDVKRQLGCSTVAQMGFMVLQCGLGFFAAALAHLILHGFYKAYLFLASGSVVAPTLPTEEADRSATALQWVVTAGTALAGGALFALLTGKSVTTLGSGLLLTLVVVIAVLHAARHVVRRAELALSVRAVAVPAVVLPALGLYAAVYNGVAALTAGLPMQVAPADGSVVHVLIGGLFVLAYVAAERGWHRASPRLYVALLNMSQPHPSTLTNQRDQYHAY
ncbi:MAG: oxidoreductase [Bacteroidetes bacterium]|jgi:NAD(P)H-quinone oxidoreductase subunit 5|nr:oxidoreductase [Bacteroidota bacterium]